MKAGGCAGAVGIKCTVAVIADNFRGDQLLFASRKAALDFVNVTRVGRILGGFGQALTLLDRHYAGAFRIPESPVIWLGRTSQAHHGPRRPELPCRLFLLPGR